MFYSILRHNVTNQLLKTMLCLFNLCSRTEQQIGHEGQIHKYVKVTAEIKSKYVVEN